MDEVLHANIFFFIASIGVVFFVALVSVALYYLIKILKSIRNIVDRIDTGSEAIAEDITQLRTYFAEGSPISHIIGMFTGKRPRRRTKKDAEE